MATNYGYVKRDPEDRINWAKVGTSVSNKLTDEINRRDTLKQSIKDESKKFDEEIFTLPETDNDLLKTEALNFANIVSQQRLSQDRRLADGSLNLRDYTVERQNLGNTQQLMSQFTKEKVVFDKNFAEKWNKGELSAQSASDRAQNEKYSDLNNYGLQVDEFGNGFMAKKDGAGGFDPNDTLGLRSMVVNNSRLIGMPDVKKIVDTTIGFAAKEYKIANVDGLKTVDDAWQNKNFQNSVSDYINAQLVNPDATSAILGTYLTGYTYQYLDGKIGGTDNKTTLDGKAEVIDKNEIPLRRNSRGVWEFDQESEQGIILKKIVADKILEQVRGKMDRTETDFTDAERTNRNKNFKDNKSESESIIQTGKIFNGTEQEIKDALVYFEGKNGVKYNLLKTSGATLVMQEQDSEGNIREFTIDRSKGISPTSFLTQASQQFGNFDLASAKTSKAFKGWQMTDGVLSSPSLVSDEISFGGSNVTPKAFDSTLSTRSTLDGENMVNSIDIFQKAFKADRISAIENEFIAFGFNNSDVELIDDITGVYVDYIKIDIPGSTSMPLLVKQNIPYAQMVKLIEKIENNKKLGKKPLTQNQVNKMISLNNVTKTTYGKALGYDAADQLEQQWNGGDGVPSSGDESSNGSSSGINGSNYNIKK
tara:strand:- start:25194 stop:27140 length:1947 start_codon:yes stop_codon:yes gene_type:complete